MYYNFLKPYLVGAGLAEPEAVFRGMVPLVPFVRVVVVVLVTVKRERGVVPVPLTVLALDGLRCGMREGVVSSKNKFINFSYNILLFKFYFSLPVLSKDKVEPCREGGFEPCRLRGREFGFEPAREPPGVNPVLVLV